MIFKFGEQLLPVEMEEWEVTEESEEQTYFDLEYTFMTYERKKN